MRLAPCAPRGATRLFWASRANAAASRIFSPAISIARAADFSAFTSRCRSASVSFLCRAIAFLRSLAASYFSSSAEFFSASSSFSSDATSPSTRSICPNSASFVIFNRCSAALAFLTVSGSTVVAVAVAVAAAALCAPTFGGAGACALGVGAGDARSNVSSTGVARATGGALRSNAAPHAPNFLFFGVAASLVGVGVDVVGATPPTPPRPPTTSPVSYDDADEYTATAGGRC
mmetsp:Transcript_9173/g.30995  ORF Transcript_9173/g.30995 Transcript_9173/m.30995 type:complete len:232 (-) Transcript_9173:451-1146(-)